MKDNEPLVSVVIPCYNHESFVRQTVQSVINQDYANIELIIIDDGSKDNSVLHIQELVRICQHRFRRFEFRSRPNKGLCATLNEALAWSEGEFFAPVASDDILRGYKTGKQVKYMRENLQCAGVFGHIEMIDATDLHLRKKLRAFRQGAKYQFRDIFLHKHKLPAPTQLLRTKLVRSVGGYDEDLIIEDWSMWLCLTKNGLSLDLMSDIFTLYRRHEGNTSSNLHAMQYDRDKVLERYSTHKLHALAVAHANLMCATDWQMLDTKKSY